MIKIMYHDPLQGYLWTELETSLYSDNTPKITTDTYVLEAITRDPKWGCLIKMDDPTEFNKAMILGQYLIDHGVVTNLYVPYFPGARQDRSNDKVDGGDLGFAAAYYASVMNMVGFESVVFIDGHSQVPFNHLNFPIEIGPSRVIDEAVNLGLITNDYDGVIAPDHGAAQRASEVAAFLNVPVYTAYKTRDVSNGTLTGFGIEPIEPGNYLIVDDICDGGGTFLGLANVLPDGVVCDLYVTHGIFSKGIDELRKVFRKIITTNSYPQYETDTIQVDVDKMLLDEMNQIDQAEKSAK